MADSSNAPLSALARIQDFEYLFASNANVSNFVSVKLSGTRNYFLWKVQMLCLLDSNNMCGVVDPAFAAPRDTGNPETMRQYNSLVKGWIFGSISENMLADVFHLGSAKAVWEKLKFKCDPTASLEEDSNSKRSDAKTKNEVSKSDGLLEANTIVEDTNSVQIIVSPENSENETDYKKELHEATIKGNWSNIKKKLKENESLVTEAIDGYGSTTLDIAVGIGHNDIVKKLFSYINDEQVLQQRVSDGSTALHIAAIVGNKQAAELLVNKNRKLLQIEDQNGEEPLQKAFVNMHLDTIGYLLKAVNNYDELELCLIWLPIAFIMLLIIFSLCFLYALMWEGAVKLAFAPIKNINNKANELKKAKVVLQLVCDKIDKKGRNEFYTHPILEAARQNAYKVVDEILFRAPEAIESTDKNGYDIIQLAIIHRSEKVYNLIYEIGERKNLYRTIVDSSKNNMLHLVGKLAPSNVLNQRTGAALQLQRELQWREEVKKLVFPTYITQENEFGETPDMLFTREHKKLVIEGEKWLKTTAESCSITAALITTIVFAAAITVPGGNNQETGLPVFKNEPTFVVFAISDAISLFASSTALLVFLSILTARFAEKDFLVSLPRRLFIGLFSLLLSTTAMMVAFSATLFLVFCEQKLWMLAPICGLAFVPIAFFVTLQFPLMADVFRSTYLPIFGKERRSVHRKFNPNDIRLSFGNRISSYIRS
ncbi:hypothetical protein QVD17_39003 [Tagetes erecta]|uniref:PGG domain-containing protein n=1 Tax=Tagetes erecta TaxID=13708 RepID=A0AAD8NGP7_TARER|nr:hypothetical protein QVD17_39003 [Tagetes erecta]